MMCICTRACHSDLRLPRSSSARVCAKLLQSCLTLCDPMDCSLPGSCVHGIFQARILEWGAIAFSMNVLVLFILISCEIQSGHYHLLLRLL